MIPLLLKSPMLFVIICRPRLPDCLPCLWLPRCVSGGEDSDTQERWGICPVSPSKLINGERKRAKYSSTFKSLVVTQTMNSNIWSMLTGMFISQNIYLKRNLFSYLCARVLTFYFEVIIILCAYAILFKEICRIQVFQVF